MEFTLLWAALTAVAFVWAGTRLWPEGLPDHPTDRMIGAAVAGLFIGRLTAMFVQGTNLFTNSGDILIVRGGDRSGSATPPNVGWLATLPEGSRRFAAHNDTEPQSNGPPEAAHNRYDFRGWLHHLRRELWFLDVEVGDATVIGVGEV